MSQKEQIKEFMLNGGKIDKLTAFKLFGCMTLAQRINDIEADGHKVETKRDPDHNNASVYWIEDYKLNLR